MKSIEEMIQELCPKGVEKVRLGDVCNFYRGSTITSKNAISGCIPVIAGSQVPSYYHNEFNREGETITVAGSGAYAGYVGYWKIPIFLSDAFSVAPNERLNTKYTFYFLKQNQERIYATQKGAGIPHVHGKDIAHFQIPLPPLPVQQVIADTLDKFTSMIENIDEEIELRQKQYEEYRNKLLSFSEDDESVEWKELGEIGEIVRGNGLQKKDFSDNGIGCIHYGQIYTKLGFSIDKPLTYVPVELAETLTKVEPGNLVIACTSENIEDVCKSVLWLGNETIVTGAHASVFKHKANPKFIAYSFMTSHFFSQKKKYAYGAKVIDIKTEKLLEIVIPIPSLSRQQEIVDILDKFELVIANLKEERELRRQQYEYYREKLLTF